MLSQLDDALLQSFMKSFYGYGNYVGDYWFVGMEEGCDSCDFEEISQRLAIWQGRGNRVLEDVRDYHLALGITWPFEKRPALQQTWKGLIRILLAVEESHPTPDQMRFYQRDHWGRTSGNSCLLELLPLPSRSTGHWIYGEHSRLPILHSRERYMEACAEWRSIHIRNMVQQHRPKAVIFYSTNSWYREWWQKIAGVQMDEASDERFYWGRSSYTTFVIMKHPTAFGVSNKYLHTVASLIQETSERSSAS